MNKLFWNFLNFRGLSSILIMSLVSFNLFAVEKNGAWDKGIHVSTESMSKCHVYTEDDSANQFYFNVVVVDGNENLSFNIFSSLDIPNDGSVVADFVFYDNSGNKFLKKRMRMNSPKESKHFENVFYINNETATHRSFELFTDLIKKSSYMEIYLFDKRWVEHIFEFDLKGSRSAIESALSECII